ncbi:protein pecanex [Anaeramoeba flamelloides]|uniref:Protein pecanex n=1 Tax=Anaeramoeba flamelloides TaxID=1746091 RepID=A0ABQ8YLB4_9EUKA|nr:protein pecanex [Anaeramoeba flamelloides]
MVTKTRTTKHSFLDENGRIQTYEIEEEYQEEVTIDSQSDNPLEKLQNQNENQNQNQNHNLGTFDYVRDDLTIEQINQLITQSERNTNLDPIALPNNRGENRQNEEVLKPEDDPSFVRIKIFGNEYLLFIDRLTLENLFDRDWNKKQLYSGLFLATITAFVSLIVSEYFYGTERIFFCITIATGLYSLLKSVQPDCSSPEPNVKGVSYSRSFYLTLFSILFLIINAVADSVDEDHSIELYSLTFHFDTVFNLILDSFKIIILFSPLIFLFGLFAQPLTFLMYIFEQFNIQFMGGTAAISIFSSILSVILDLIVIGIMYGIGILLIDPNTDNNTNNDDYKFYLFTGLLIFFSYFLSICPSDPKYFKKLIIRKYEALVKEDLEPEDKFDFLPIKKFLIDLLHSLILFIIYFALQFSKIFQNSDFYLAFQIIGICIGFIGHYIINQSRKSFPFMIFSDPILKSLDEDENFEPDGPARKLLFEKIYRFFILFEKFIIFPVIGLSVISQSINESIDLFGIHVTILLSIFTVIKFVRSGFNNGQEHYKILFFLLLFFRYDYKNLSEFSLINLLLVQYLIERLNEAFLKCRFLFIYNAPWTLAIASFAHVILSVLSIAHTALTAVTIFISTIFSMPLSPFIGSGWFLLTYPRPVRYWEKSYRTRRMDASNMKLSKTLSLDAGSSANLNNLNSIFYDHLYVSLRDSLYDDIKFGRLGKVNQGDVFLLSHEKLTALLHISSLGNGFCCYQLRGLEFRGTYCQEREIEEVKATADNSDENYLLPNFPLLSFKYLFFHRWRTWEVINKGLICRSYNVLMNPAEHNFEMYDSRKVLLKYYVSSAIYYLFTKTNVLSLIKNDTVIQSIFNFHDPNYVDGDILTFSQRVDEDFDLAFQGITARSFERVYGDFIRYCVEKYNSKLPENERVRYISLDEWQQLNKSNNKGNNNDNFHNLNDNNNDNNDNNNNNSKKNSNDQSDENKDSSDTDDIELEDQGTNLNQNKQDEMPIAPLVLNLCFAIAVAARRVLASASLTTNNRFRNNSFLDKYYALFKGDLRLNPKDDWIVTDISMLENVIGKAAKVSLSLFQYYFISPKEYNEPKNLFGALEDLEDLTVICAETDPEWRKGIIKEKSSLLSLRRQTEDMDEHHASYYVLQLELRHIKWTAIKINKECVRGLWSSQIQELVYLKNLNAERGSIQRCENVLRNLQNQACDIPTGYPISISPICTSYSKNTSDIFYKSFVKDFYKQDENF